MLPPPARDVHPGIPAPASGSAPWLAIVPAACIVAAANPPSPEYLATVIVSVLSGLGIGAGIGYSAFLTKVNKAKIVNLREYEEAYKDTLQGQLAALKDMVDKAAEERKALSDKVSECVSDKEKLMSAGDELRQSLSLLLVRVLEHSDWIRPDTANKLRAEVEESASKTVGEAKAIGP